MANSSIFLNQKMYDYILDVAVIEPPYLKELREETAIMEERDCQISPDQGRFMELLGKIMSASVAIEVGVFTGYSSICLARGLQKGGRLIACDINKEWTDIAQKYWKKAGLSGTIDLRLGPAEETLKALINEGMASKADLGFIDADKTGYDRYYELMLTLLRPGGAILFDNMLRNGMVVDPPPDDPDTRAIDSLNRKLRDDERVAICLVPIGDGVTIAVKR